MKKVSCCADSSCRRKAGHTGPHTESLNESRRLDEQISRAEFDELREKVEKETDRWRVEVVLVAARWAQNILVEVQGNHARFIPQETRESLRTAIQQLSEIPHTVPTRIGAHPQRKKS